MHQDIFNIEPGTAVIIGDFKENFKLDYNRVHEQYDYFQQDPVTCLSFVVHHSTFKCPHSKKVYKILSKCLSHNASFIIRALMRILKEPEFKGVSTIKQWSDGAGHFCNTEFLEYLRTVNLLNSNKDKTVVEVDYFSASHGKSECDSAFGYFSRLLRSCVPADGIKSMNDLVDFFQKETSDQSSKLLSSTRNSEFFLRSTCKEGQKTGDYRA
ncbi:MAG: hypothetical protein EZS28_017926 [Streblomastix strix]|uniref:Uncharacterized protein n=1 Tax=Streblomastix strix TaxID=222440 RepID=A0A5J4VVF7_9EUKA|nr:MAG: hypothetical protein EZS28_017926 [Streblomastix strix]